MIRWWERQSTESKVAVIGLLVAILGLPAGYLALVDRGSAPDTPSTSTIAAPTTSQPDNGVGTTTTGQATDQSDFIEFADFGLPTYYTPLSADELGVPPKFELDKTGSIEWHCKEWNRWLPTVKATPPNGDTYVLVKAPSSTAVVITRVEIEILRYRPWNSTGSLIRCGYGADYYEASVATFSFLQNNSKLHVSRLTENRDPLEFTVPPDQFRVAAGLTEVLALHPQGRPGFYEWSMTVHAIINQKQVVERLGTEDEPLLTAIFPKDQPYGGDAIKTIDWDLVSCQWTEPPYGSGVKPDDPRRWSCG